MLEPTEWEIETAFYVNERGIDPAKARTFTILRWMWCGDLRPLESAIVEGREIDRAALNLLADMISGNASRFGKPPPFVLELRKTRGPGRRKQPELFARNLIAARSYAPEPKRSEAAFCVIADAIGTGPDIVRQAVTAYRKARSHEN